MFLTKRTKQNRNLEQVTISSVHQHHHAGEMFHFSTRVNGVANSGTVILHIKTGSISPHIVFFHSSDGAYNADLYEDPNLSSDGTPLAVQRTNRNIPGSSLTTVFTTPSINANGTILHQNLHGSSGPLGAGSFSLENNEWILKPSNSYLLILTNTSGNNSNFSVGGWFYEQE